VAPDGAVAACARWRGSVSPAALLLLEALEDPAARREVVAALLPELRSALTAEAPAADGWLNSRDAAAYLGMTYDAFKKHQHLIRSEQAAPGCRRWYRRVDLDAWRLSGARVPA
jgi:hypothetical protein